MLIGDVRWDCGNSDGRDGGLAKAGAGAFGRAGVLMGGEWGAKSVSALPGWGGSRCGELRPRRGEHGGAVLRYCTVVSAMGDLNNDEIRALAKAVGLTLREPELTQVAHSLNAMLAEMAAINPPGFSLEEYVAVAQPADLEDAE